MMREGDLHALIAAANARLPKGVMIPPGDDMAQVAIAGGSVLVACDQVIEGRHFVPNTPIELIARKAIARNVSDVAAMAGRPLACLCAATLPSDWPESAVRALTAALQRHAEDFGCPLVGGDTSWHGEPGHPLQLSMTILALPHATGRVVRRDQALDGDAVVVSGACGGSFGADGLGRHLRFEPRVRLARELVDHFGDRLGAMIDVSDGLGRDLDRVAQASSVAMLVEGDRIPVHQGCSLEQALRDGEDHELAFTLRADAAEDLPETLAGVPLSVIGRVRALGDVHQVGARVFLAGAWHAMGSMGWEHGPGAGA
jgi:thiamine-monophosphate kinase